MKKGNGILIIVLCSILILLLLQVLVQGTKKESIISVMPVFFNTNIEDTRMTEENEYTASLDNIKHIKLDTSVDDIIIEEGNGNDIKIIEKSNFKLEESEKLKINEKDDVLEIVRDDKKKLLSRNSINRKLEIYLPKNYNNSLTLKNDVGDIELLLDLKLDKLNISQKLGDLKLESKIECDTFEFENSTGNTKINNIKGKGNIEGSVGDIDCYFDEITGDIFIDTSTGDIDVSINEDARFKLNSKNNVGNLDTNISLDNFKTSEKSISGEYGKSPKYILKLETNVGDIDINIE